MKNRTLLTLLYATTILLQILSSLLPETVRVYFSPSALLLPLLLGVTIFRKRCGARIVAYEGKCRERTALSYLLFPLILLGIIGVSALSAWLFSLVGITSVSTLSVPLVSALIFYAVIPALLEEALYRYLPMLALQDESPLAILVFSSIAFGAAHLSLISLPYALFAGIGLFLVNFIAKSPLPSFLLHLINNVLGVLLLFYPDAKWLLPTILSSIGALTLITMIALVKKRRLLEEVASELREGEPTPLLTFELIAFFILSLCLSLLQL